MILPINALSPKVFRGNSKESRIDAVMRAKRDIALINAAGISTVLGGVTTVAARSYTNGWKHAGIFGAGAAAISMLFLGPKFLYKSGIGTYSKTTDKLENYSKSILRKTA